MQAATQSFRRQKAESAQAHQAARAYFELGADRSLEAVSRKLGKSKALMERWSSRWEWVVRAEDYDLHLLALEDAHRERQAIAEAEKWQARRNEIREDGWRIFRALKKKAERMLQFPITRIEKTSEDGKTTVLINPADWNFNTASRMMDAALRIGRLAAELSTENLGLDVSKMSVKQLELLIAGKPLEAVLAAEDSPLPSQPHEHSVTPCAAEDSPLPSQPHEHSVTPCKERNPIARGDL